MKVGFKAPRIVGVFVLLLSVAAVGVAALVDGSQKGYSILDKAFYLSAEEGIWIRPGLNLEIKDVYIAANLKPVVIFRITDDKGQPLDREGNVTPGPVSTSFLIAYIPQNASQYVSYVTRTQKSSITGQSAVQATSDSGGTYTSQGDGTYMYQFKTVLPANYDQTATHTVGIYSTRNMAEFGQPNYYANALKSWVPSGSPVTKIRDVVGTTACNQCHDPLALHGGSRREIGICVLCHSPQTSDPDTGNSVDMPLMTHKIHMGPNLPSGNSYKIVGGRNNDTLTDFAEVTYPQAIQNCAQCHKDAQQVNNWMLNPTRVTCGSCHDNVNFASGENHAGGPQKDDRYCSLCHWPEGEEYDASISGAHLMPDKSSQLRNPVWHLLSITDTAPGQKPTVKFQITDKTGAYMKPSDFANPNGRLRLDIAGPNTDYRWYIQETASGAPYDEATHTATYTFTKPIPADTSGSCTLAMEGRLNTTLNPGTTKEFLYEESPINITLPFAVTDETAVARRTVVDTAKCNKCHYFLEGHGANRNQVAVCVVCHNPTKTAAGATEADPLETVEMKVMIHKIHTGMELTKDYNIDGTSFWEVTYPGDRRNCQTCHIAGTYTVPLPAGTTPTDWPANYWTPILPTSAACLGCHDTVEAAAHAYVNTAPFGEACGACHSSDAEFGVDKVHAR